MRCRDCSNCYIDCRNYMFCCKKNCKYIGIIGVRERKPEWCPLEDYKESKCSSKY